MNSRYQCKTEMRRARISIFAVLFLLSARPALSGSGASISPEELAKISERGRALYAYDQAAWHATDALLATHPDKSEDGRYIARKTDAGWIVAFGALF